MENSSSHVEHQTELLAEEYDRYGVAFEEENVRGRVERMTAEYDEADYIMTPSSFARQSFFDYGFTPDRVKCVPFGVDPPQGASRATETGNKDGETVRFIYSGSITLRKGPQYLLEAWDQLDLPNAELVLTSNVGTTGEPLVDRYKDRADIHFLGWVDDLVGTLQRGSVFVFPSIEEGSAMVTYEAMSAGLPMITTFNSGWVGDDGTHGIEVPIRDPDAIGDAMEYLYERPEKRRQMGRAARELIKTEYTTDDYGDRIYECYRHILSTKD